jgi:cysteine desulfurase/selenocysteine lyase
MNIQKIREDFPILKRKVNGKQLIYFDNAATTQKPVQVLEAVNYYYKNTNANIHRGVHKLSEEATQQYEESRKKIKSFIGAKSEKEVVFTRGTTESINLVAASLNLKKGDEILTTVMEHHSNIVPWQLAKIKKGIDLKFVDIKDEGVFDINDFENAITKNTKLVTVVHASNVLGTINDVKKIGKICKDNNTLLLVDGAQSTPHMEIDVRDIGCDFFAFSGHKMCAPTGIGALYAKKDLLEEMMPYHGGGEMIKEVHLDNTTWNDLPWKFEAGTPNIAGTIGFRAAIDYLNKIGIKNIRKHEKELLEHAFEKMDEINGIKIFGPKDTDIKTGVISFNLGDVHSHDLATVLDNDGIAIRSGHHCAQPLVERLGANAMSRASFYLYNTKDEIDKFIEVLNNSKKIFKIK